MFFSEFNCYKVMQNLQNTQKKLDEKFDEKF